MINFLYIIISCVTLIVACDRKISNVVDPYDKYEVFKSEYFDSLKNENMLMRIDFEEIHNKKVTREYVFKKRIGFDIDSTSLIPIKSCSIINDSTVALASDSGIVRFINSNSGAVIQEFNTGMGPLEYQKPQKIYSNSDYITIYDEHRNFIHILNNNRNHYAYLPLRNYSNLSTAWITHQPAYGIDSKGVWITNDINYKSTHVEHYDYSGTLIENFSINEWFPNAPAIFQRFGVWSSEKYLAVASVGVPYIVIYDKASRKIVKAFVIYRNIIDESIARALDVSRNFVDIRHVQEIHFIQDIVFINVMSTLYSYDLFLDNNEWIGLSVLQPTDEVLIQGEIVNQQFITTGGDSTNYYTSSNHFYGENLLLRCPVARDFVDIYEYKGIVPK